MKTVVVNSASMVGSYVAQGLINQGASVRCMNRWTGRPQMLPKGAELYTADLDQPDSLEGAFEGVDNIFLFLPISRNETSQGLAAVETASRSTAKKIVYVSAFMPAGAEGIPHLSSKMPIEQSLREWGGAYTILRPNHFFQSDLAVRPQIVDHGLYPLPVGSVGLNRVDIRDVADAAVHALIYSGYEGQVFDLHGPEPLTGREIALIYSIQLGREVRYAGDDLKAWEKQAKNVLPPWLCRDLRIMYRHFQRHGMTASEADLARQQAVLRHAPRSFRQFAEQAAAEWKTLSARAA